MLSVLCVCLTSAFNWLLFLCSGWIELINPDSRADAEALVRLLKPKGSLFSALLSQIPDSSLFYEIPSAVFPSISQKIIEAGHFDLLPASVYEGRLVKSGDGFVLRLSKARCLCVWLHLFVHSYARCFV